jgi:diketogulonate reductase-like aldo/keto reductase
MVTVRDGRTRLTNGIEMPQLGLGTWQMPPGKRTERAVRSALDIGYRLIDTAKLYGNEADVGRAVRGSGIPRDEIFVTTKLWNSDHGYDTALRAFAKSLRELDLGYVDLYLVHWPETGLRAETWKAFERILKEGTARAIGVSNYTIRHLDEMSGYATIPPAVNQVEFNPFLYQRELLDRCRKAGIQLEAYSPLTKGRRLDDPRLVAVAEKYGKTPAQIILRWCIDHEVVAVPKSEDSTRQRENADIFGFHLAPNDIAVLDRLEERYRTSWDPTFVP